MSGKKECDRKEFVDEHYFSDDGGLTRKCNFCGKTFKGKPPIQRLIIHLAKLEGRDVRPCLRVNPVVEREAVQLWEAIEASTQTNQRKRKHSSISTNPVSGRIDPSSSMPQHVMESEGHERMTEHVQSELPRVETRGREYLLQEGNDRVASEPRGQSVCGRSIEMLAGDKASKSSPIVRSALFQEYIDKIWFSLIKDNVLCVGVYGLGGVGKSTLVREIYEGILTNPSKFEHAYWFTVQPDSDISELQDKIARKLQINLPKEDDDVFETRKALMKALMEKGRSVIILDNMWKDFRIEEVGVPLDSNYCKLIITSRSLDVCRRMDCREENIIKVEPLKMEIAQKLFEKTLSREIPSYLKAISKDIVKASYRLPAQISKLARNLRGVDDIHEWRNELNKLRSLSNSDNEEIFGSLIRSYKNLDDSALQECFLSCALLFRGGYEIDREYLIEYLRVEGVVERMESRQAEIDKGHTMLNKLENICFLNGEGPFWGEKVTWVHELVRDMALSKLRRDSWVVIDTVEKFNELLDKQSWEMEKLSFYGNREMEEILMECSPNCPNLNTLIFRDPWNLSSIGESFFKQMHGLRFLDLAYSDIDKLPDSISELVNLVALILCCCENLKFVPSLAKLTSLEALDLGCCHDLIELLLGMENLFNLRCLNLEEMKEFPREILPELGCLQSLNAYGQLLASEEVQSLKKLECLECMFNEWEYIKILMKEAGVLPWSDYNISVCGVLYKCGYPPRGIGKVLEFNGCKSEYLQIPRDVEGLSIKRCDGLELSFSSSVYCSNEGTFSQLRRFEVTKCGSIKKLFPQRLLINLQQLNILEVGECELIEEIIANEDEGCMMSSDERSGGVPSTNINVALPNLTSLTLWRLPQLKSICRGKLVCDALITLEVTECPQLKRMPISFPDPNNGQLSPHPSLMSVWIDDKAWECLEWVHPQAKDLLSPYRGTFSN